MEQHDPFQLSPPFLHGNVLAGPPLRSENLIHSRTIDLSRITQQSDYYRMFKFMGRHSFHYSHAQSDSSMQTILRRFVGDYMLGKQWSLLLRSIKNYRRIDELGNTKSISQAVTAHSDCGDVHILVWNKISEEGVKTIGVSKGPRLTVARDPLFTSSTIP